MLKTMGTVVALCGLYFAVGVAITAGCVIGQTVAEAVVDKFGTEA